MHTHPLFTIFDAHTRPLLAWLVVGSFWVGSNLYEGVRGIWTAGRRWRGRRRAVRALDGYTLGD